MTLTVEIGISSIQENVPYFPLSGLVTLMYGPPLSTTIVSLWPLVFPQRDRNDKSHEWKSYYMNTTNTILKFDMTAFKFENKILNGTRIILWEY